MGLGLGHGDRVADEGFLPGSSAAGTFEREFANHHKVLGAIAPLVEEMDAPPAVEKNKVEAAGVVEREDAAEDRVFSSDLFAVPQQEEPVEGLELRLDRVGFGAQPS